MSEKKRFLLRVNADLYDLLEKWAADELRSVNGQIEFLLLEASRKAGRLKAQARQTRGSPETTGTDTQSAKPDTLARTE